MLSLTLLLYLRSVRMRTRPLHILIAGRYGKITSEFIAR